MRFLIALFVISVPLLLATCARPQDAGPAGNGSGVSNDARTASGEGQDSSFNRPEPSSPGASNTGPRTIRDFYLLLPEEYFVLEACERAKDKDCRQAKLDYLKTFTEVEDTANGYLKGGCDGAQSCLEMTIFKRPDGTYLVAVSTESEMIIEQYFLDYAGGGWSDVAARTIPEYGKDKFYELPRRGTTMKVFAKKVVEKGEDYEIAEKGAKLYDLVWKDGKFSISK